MIQEVVAKPEESGVGLDHGTALGSVEGWLTIRSKRPNVGSEGGHLHDNGQVRG